MRCRLYSDQIALLYGWSEGRSKGTFDIMHQYATAGERKMSECPPWATPRPNKTHCGDTTCY